MWDELVAIADTTEETEMIVQAQCFEGRYYLDIQVGEIVFTAYPTKAEIDALRRALDNL